MKQKSRIQWIKLGDHNTKYCAAVAKEREHKKQIYELQSLSGHKITNLSEIKSKIVSFYKGLMGSSAYTLPAINRTIMRKSPQLNHDQQIALCAKVTEKEIKASLWAIWDDKAPGVDGYNVFFFKRTWPIIKDDLVHAVQDFFSTGELYRAINCTVVTLVPKIVSYYCERLQTNSLLHSVI